jgi:hypothetical protein
LFDYTDRHMKLVAEGRKVQGPAPFPAAMWEAYRAKYEQEGAGKPG